MISQLLIPIAGTILFYVLFHALSIVYRELTSPLRYMAGPKTRSLLLGNSQEMMEDPTLTDRWRSEFGATFRFKGVFGISELHTSDIKAINHVISKSNVYRRAPFARARSGQLTGNGILSVDLDDHKRFNPAFGVAQMRVITEVFVEKAIQLRDMWAQQVRDNHGTVQIKVVSWLRLMTLEIIGKAGFNYDFDALVPDKNKKPNELNEVLKQIFHSPLSNRYSLVPVLKLMPLPGKSLFLAARTEMFSIGHRILASSKADIVASEGEKNLGGKRDLLSTLLKANLSPDVPANQRLSDRELIPTFFVAGHETTSTAASWALHALSQNIIAQTKLRKELLTVSTDNPTMDELNSLPYLESVVRETLRIYSPVTFRHRMAMQEDVLPLSKPYVDKEGEPHNSLVIPKGQIIYIPILAVNTDKDIWGPDAREWKPERWETIPEEVSAIPTVWGNLLTFFAGPHNCVGSRFAVLELKAMLFTIIRAFEVEKAVPEVALRPIMLAEGNKKSSLPLILKAYDVHGV
ncbi:cytochrome P450 [Mycena olivaceomarginata]|nr:cytochrome P450 [Mycena olivaceomarginata]